MNAVAQYTALMAACNILRMARIEVHRTESGSPAWAKLLHAGQYVETQARAILAE